MRVCDVWCVRCGRSVRARRKALTLYRCRTSEQMLLRLLLRLLLFGMVQWSPQRSQYGDDMDDAGDDDDVVLVVLLVVMVAKIMRLFGRL